MGAVTTRRYHAGRHGLTVQVNGQAVAAGHFTLQRPKSDKDVDKGS